MKDRHPGIFEILPDGAHNPFQLAKASRRWSQRQIVSEVTAEFVVRRELMKKLNTKVRVSVARSMAQLSEQRRKYEALLRRCPRFRGFFYQWQWLQIMSPLYLSTGESMFFLLFWRGDDLIGVAPLQLENKAHYHAAVRRLHFYGGIEGILDNLFGDILVADAADLGPCVKALRHYLLKDGRREWDLLDLRCVAETAPMLVHLRRELPDLCIAPQQMQTHVNHLPASFDDFVVELGKGFYKDILRRERRLREAFSEVEIHAVGAFSETELGEIGQLHSRRQDQLSAAGLQRDFPFADEAKRKTIVDIIDYVHDAGCGMHFLLRVDGRIAAFSIGFRHRNTLFLFMAGYDIDLHRYSPMKLLDLHIHRRVIADPSIRTINWGPGTTDYKSRFCNQVIPNVDVTYKNPVRLSSRMRIWIWERMVKHTSRIRTKVRAARAMLARDSTRLARPRGSREEFERSP